MNTKSNALWRKNEKKIVDAVIDLMREQSGRIPTVRAVCERAHVNRSTFYAHFDNVTDLILKHGKTLNAIRAQQVGIDVEQLSPMSIDLMPLLESIQSNAEYYRQVSPAFGEQLSRTNNTHAEMIINKIVVPAGIAQGLTAEDELKLFTAFISGGFKRVLFEWLDGGCEPSTETVAHVLEVCLDSLYRSSTDI